MLRVTWTDSGTFHSDGWQTKEKILSKLGIGTVVSVGLLFHEDDETLFLALSYDPDHDTYYGVQAIQKSSILSRNELEIAYLTTELRSTASTVLDEDDEIYPF